MVDVFTTPTDVGSKEIANLAPSVNVVATLETSPTWVALWGIERGAALLDGFTAGARAVGLFWGGQAAPENRTADQITTAGWLLFDIAVRWLDPPSTPTAPLNLTPSAGDGRVMLEWDAPTTGPVDGYRILQSQTPGGPYTQVATTTLLSYTVGSLTNGTPYYFIVKAYNFSGDGAPSAEVSATPQAGVSLRARGWFELK